MSDLFKDIPEFVEVSRCRDVGPQELILGPFAGGHRGESRITDGESL